MTLAKILTDIRNLFPNNDDVWYILTAAVITAFNHPEDIQPLYKLVEQTVDAKFTDPNEKLEELTRVTLRMREGIFKSFIGSGFPKVINSLDNLRQATPKAVLERLPKKPLRTENSWQDILEQREKGRKLFDVIYSRHSKRVESNMDLFYPDLAQTALHAVYGIVLAGPPVLSGKESSLTLATTLAALDIPSQLRSHTYGALHQGATKEDVDRFHKVVAALRQHYGIQQGTAKL